jgi:hypothetical protein
LEEHQPEARKRKGEEALTGGEEMFFASLRQRRGINLE